MNNTQNLVNNEDNTILQQKNYPSAISESEKMCSLDGYKTCGDSGIARKENVINSVYRRITYKMVVLLCTIN